MTPELKAALIIILILAIWMGALGLICKAFPHHKNVG